MHRLYCFVDYSYAPRCIKLLTTIGVFLNYIFQGIKFLFLNKKKDYFVLFCPDLRTKLLGAKLHVYFKWESDEKAIFWMFYNAGFNLIEFLLYKNKLIKCRLYLGVLQIHFFFKFTITTSIFNCLRPISSITIVQAIIQNYYCKLIKL